MPIFEDGGAAYGTLYSIMALANVLHYLGALSSRPAIALAATGLLVRLPTVTAVTLYFVLFSDCLGILLLTCSRNLVDAKQVRLFVPDLQADARPNGLPSWCDRFLLTHFQLKNAVTVDTFRTKPLAKTRAELLSHAPALLAASFGLVACQYISAMQGPALLVHALVGALHIYSALQLFGSVLSVLFLGVARIELPQLMKNPHNAHSLQDFWGNRWNSVVQQSLHFYVYRPLRQSGASKPVCVLATFASSGLLHAYAMWVAGASLSGCCSVTGYFVAQAVLLLVEAKMLPQNHGTMPFKLWTFACLLLPLPLATEPVFNMLVT